MSRAFLASLVAALGSASCATEPEIDEEADPAAAVRVVLDFETQRIRAQRYPDIREQDIEVTAEFFDHVVSIQDEGFHIDPIDPATRLARIRYSEIVEVKLVWDPVSILIPLGTLGIFGPQWYSAWLELESDRQVLVGRSKSTRDVFPAWMNPVHYLSPAIEEQVRAFETLRRQAARGERATSP
jgi:hypothetical protein